MKIRDPRVIANLMAELAKGWTEEGEQDIDGYDFLVVLGHDIETMGDFINGLLLYRARESGDDKAKPLSAEQTQQLWDGMKGREVMELLGGRKTQ